MASRESGTDTRNEVYSRSLTAKQAALFADASSDMGLDSEIKLLRTMISTLGKNLGVHAATILRGMTVLCRIVEIQRRAGADTSELERVLLEAAEEALQGLQSIDDEQVLSPHLADPLVGDVEGSPNDGTV